MVMADAASQAAASSAGEDQAAVMEKLLRAQVQQMEAKLLARMEDELERRTRAIEASLLAKMHDAKTLMTHESNNVDAGGENKVQQDWRTSSRSPSSSSATTEAAKTQESLRRMKMFADSMVDKVQDVEARLDVLELRAAGVDEKQEQAELAFSRLESRTVAAAAPAAAGTESKNGRLIEGTDRWYEDQEYRVMCQDNRKRQSMSAMQLNETVGKLEDLIKTVETIKQTLAGHTTILNDAPEAQRRFLLTETAVYKHEEGLLNMSKGFNSLSQHFQAHIQQSQASQIERDQVARQLMDRHGETIKNLEAQILAVQESIKALQLGVAEGKREIAKARQAMSDAHEEKKKKKSQSDADSTQTMAEMEKTVAKHQNALVQMRDYLTQHQEFIDGLCKSLGIQFAGAEVDESTQKLPVKFVVDVVHAQQVVQGKVTTVGEQVQKLEKEVSDAMAGYKSVRTAILEDRQIIEKVVSALDQRSNAHRGR